MRRGGEVGIKSVMQVSMGQAAVEATREGAVAVGW